jgi:hypothetical protein
LETEYDGTTAELFRSARSRFKSPYVASVPQPISISSCDEGSASESLKMGVASGMGIWRSQGPADANSNAIDEVSTANSLFEKSNGRRSMPYSEKCSEAARAVRSLPAQVIFAGLRESDT